MAERASVFALLATLLLVPSLAHAEGERVEVAKLVVEGEMADHLRSGVEESIGEGLARGAVEVVQTDGQFVLRATVTVAKPDYVVKLQLVEGESDEVVTSTEKTCDLCGAQELRELVSDLAATVARKAGSVTKIAPTLVIESTPPGAAVLIDGEQVGLTPLELEVSEGSHEITVQKEGFMARTQSLAFEQGVRESLAVTLESAGPDKRAKMFRTIGWAALGAGVGAAASGVALIVINDREISSDCSGDNRDDDGDCKYVHQTLAGGLALAGVGAALIATGVTFAVLGYKKKKPAQEKQPEVQALFGPGMIGLRGRF